MPNTIITPSIIARESLMLLRNNAVMANLVHRDFSREFVAGVGDTITIRKPAKFQANEFEDEGPIVVQDATQSKDTVVMDKLLDVSFAVTSKEMALDIDDFSKEFLVPAMQAFANQIDGYLLALGAKVPNKVTQAGAVTAADLVAARKFLTQAAAPLTDRRFVYNSDTEADLLNTDLFIHADQVGDAGTALREASLGRKYGMDFYVDQNMDATGDKGLAFHKNAFALVTRMLEQPQGAAKSAIMSYDGFGLRVVYDYDISKKKDIVSIDMLCGVKTLQPELAAHIAA